MVNISKKMQGQISRKEKEIQQLELDRQELDVKILNAHAYITGVKDSMRHLPKDEVDKDSASSLRKGKSIAKIYDILKHSGSPMHITDILTALGKDTDTKSQQATGSQLNNYVRDDRIFMRPLANTFGLKEWDTKPLTSLENTEDAQTGLLLDDEG